MKETNPRKSWKNKVVIARTRSLDLAMLRRIHAGSLVLGGGGGPILPPSAKNPRAEDPDDDWGLPSIQV